MLEGVLGYVGKVCTGKMTYLSHGCFALLNSHNAFFDGALADKAGHLQ